MHEQVEGSGADEGTGSTGRTPAALPGPAVRPTGESRPERKRRALLLAATMFAVAAAAVATPLAMRSRRESSPPNPERRAIEIRREAARACEERRWLECRRQFDAAKELDPRGDERQEVEDWRRIIDNALTDL